MKTKHNLIQTCLLCAVVLLATVPAALQAQWDYTTNNGTITITGYTGPGGDVVIPGTINVGGLDLPVTSIGDWAFSSKTSLTNITIPNSVTNIGDFAFSWCSGLSNVTIGNGVTSIGGHAFFSCTSLTSVAIPNSVTNIANYAFYMSAYK
jgi:hypothetical protein